MSIRYNTFGELYFVEEIVISGFEIFQPTFQEIKKPFKLSPHALEYIPLSVDTKEPIKKKLFKDMVDNKVKKRILHQIPTSLFIPQEKLVEKANDDKTTTVAKVSSINLSTIRPSRGGVIISTVIEGMKWYGLGQDWKTGEITDYGGGIYYGQDDNGRVIGRKSRCNYHSPRARKEKCKIDKNVVQGCLREFREESLNVYPEITSEILNNSTALFTEKMMIIIIPLDVDPVKISKLFSEKVSKLEYHEIKSIFWIPDFILKEKLLLNKSFPSSPFKLYSKVSTLLKSAAF
jgi:hypothetical protein